MVIERIDRAVDPSFDVYRVLRMEIGDDHWEVATLAQYLGINSRTLRAQAKAGKFPEANYRVRSGSLSLQLYDRTDAIAVQDFYLSTGRSLGRKIDATKTLADQKW